MTQGPAFSETYPVPGEELPETELDLAGGMGGAADGQGNLPGYGEPAVQDYDEPDEPEDPMDPTGQEVPSENDDEEGGAETAPARRRAAERAGRAVKCYVKAPGSKDPEHNGRSHSHRQKQKRSRDGDDDRHKGGGGGEWWRRKVKEAKATHGETCRCTLCMSPLL